MKTTAKTVRCGPSTTLLTAVDPFALESAKLDRKAALSGGLWAV